MRLLFSDLMRAKGRRPDGDCWLIRNARRHRRCAVEASPDDSKTLKKLAFVTAAAAIGTVARLATVPAPHL